MAEEETGKTGTEEQGKTEFKPITSQEEFEKALGKRLERERSKYADYDDIKTKAAEYDKAQEAAKTEQQKLAERAEAAEKRAAEFESKALRSEVAAAKGVPAGSLSGTTKEELEKSADDLIAWRDKNAPTTRTTSRERLRSGASGGGTDAMTPKERAAAALRDMRRG